MVQAEASDLSRTLMLPVRSLARRQPPVVQAEDSDRRQTLTLLVVALPTGNLSPLR